MASAAAPVLPPSEFEHVTMRCRMSYVTREGACSPDAWCCRVTRNDSSVLAAAFVDHDDDVSEADPSEQRDRHIPSTEEDHDDDYVALHLSEDDEGRAAAAEVAARLDSDDDERIAITEDMLAQEFIFVGVSSDIATKGSASHASSSSTAATRHEEEEDAWLPAPRPPVVATSLRYSHNPYAYDPFPAWARFPRRDLVAQEPFAFLPTPMSTGDAQEPYAAAEEGLAASASGSLSLLPAVMCCYHKQGKVCKMGAACWYSHDGVDSTPCHYGAACKAGHAPLARSNNVAPISKRSAKRHALRAQQSHASSYSGHYAGDSNYSDYHPYALPAGHVGYQTVHPTDIDESSSMSLGADTTPTTWRDDAYFAAEPVYEAQDAATAMQPSLPSAPRTAYGTYPSYPSPMPCSHCGATEGVTAQEFPVYNGKRKSIGVRGHCGQCMSTFLIAS